MTNAIHQNIESVRKLIHAACEEGARAPDAVTLLAVSKTFPAEAVRVAFAGGLRRFGENYVQEGVDKIAQLADLRDAIEWHMIGPLQSNKTKIVAEQFDWVHTVDRLKIAQRLSDQRPDSLAPLQICLQVNVSGESSKSGLSPDEVDAVAHSVSHLPRLRLRGLMAIPSPTDNPAEQRLAHRQLAACLDRLRHAGLPLDVLSMGMSADMHSAILEGATMVRVGSALFGRRAAHPAETAPA